VGYFKNYTRNSVNALTLPAALAVAFAASPAGATVFDVASSAYDVGVNLSLVDGLVSAEIGPFVQASGVAAPGYNVSHTLLSANAAADLMLGTVMLPVTLATVGVSTGVVNASASSPWPIVTSTASSTIDDLSLGIHELGGFLPLTFLDVTATTITSTSSASGLVHPNTATGSSSIEDLKISGLALGLLPPIDLTGTISPPANDVILNLAGLTITLNQQIVMEAPGGTGISIETNAIAIDFSNFALGTGLVNGDIIVGDSFASVPEPATWVEMLAGFGAAGFLMLGRAKAKKTAAA
jgi:hypothetical protein